MGTYSNCNFSRNMVLKSKKFTFNNLSQILFFDLKDWDFNNQLDGWKRQQSILNVEECFFMSLQSYVFLYKLLYFSKQIRKFSCLQCFLLPSPEERVLHLGLFVCLSVCLSAQNFRIFLRNCLLNWDEIFTIDATTHVEWFNDNDDVMGHVVWQPYWKKRKNFGPLHL